ncbi:hypothetical protein D3C79_624530 [compost metagenome]
MPTIEGLIQPGGDLLVLHRHTPIGFGGAHQVLQGFLAQLDLILKYGQIFLQQRIAVVLAHFLDQHTHGRQRRTQLMGSASSLGRDRQQLLIAQAIFTPLCTQLLLAAQLFCHFCRKESDHRSGQGNAQPHAVDLHLLPRHGEGFQRVELHQQQAVGCQSDT